MPTSDLDLPLLPSAEQIRRREFATLRRGYDPDQVRDYLEAVAVQVETLEKDLKEARRQLEAKATEPAVATPAAPAGDPYDRISKRFAGLLATADREASRIVDEAKTEAEAGTPVVPEGSVVVTLALSAPDAELLVWGQEVGTVWLSREPVGTPKDGTRTVSEEVVFS